MARHPRRPRSHRRPQARSRAQRRDASGLDAVAPVADDWRACVSVLNSLVGETVSVVVGFRDSSMTTGAYATPDATLEPDPDDAASWLLKRDGELAGQFILPAPEVVTRPPKWLDDRILQLHLDMVEVRIRRAASAAR